MAKGERKRQPIDDMIDAHVWMRRQETRMTQPEFITGGMKQDVQNTTAEIYKYTPLGLLDIWLQLIKVAHELLAQSQPAIAIVIAAAAGEWAAEYSMVKLMSEATTSSAPVRKLKDRIRGPRRITWSLEDRGIVRPTPH